MSFNLASLRHAVAADGRVAPVVAAETRSSAPGEADAAMLVWTGGKAGTIGGGALEWEATTTARARLAEGGSPRSRYALGPEAVRLVDGWLLEPMAPRKEDLWIFGAGHVGRALVGTPAPLPGWQITWVDNAEDRLPADLTVRSRIAAGPAAAVAEAPADAHHLILTYSHALDLALCHAVLNRGFASAGLIGSATNWARFRKRLIALGHRPTAVDRIDCPIGDPALGKHPHAVAIGVASRLLGAPPAQVKWRDRA